MQHPYDEDSWAETDEATHADAFLDELLGRTAYEWAPEAGSLPTLRYLSELPHDLGSLDPGIFNADDSLKFDATLHANLRRKINDNSRLKRMGIALVDLTGGTPRLAAHKPTVHFAGASVPKVAAMYAAHQMRHDLNRLSVAEGTTVLADLLSAADTTWRETQVVPPGTTKTRIPAASIRGLRRLDRLAKLILVRGAKVRTGSLGKPRPAAMFASAGGTPITVEFSSTGESNAALDTIDDEMKVAATRRRAKRKIDGLGFAERMKLMISWSNNYAASTCIRDVGFHYIASVLLQSGLYHPKRAGGLWLGSNYGGGVWRGALLGKGSTQAATAVSLAAFMTMVVKGQLRGSTDMRRMMGTDRFTRSPLADPVAPAISLSKLGLLKGLEMDVALVQKDVCGTTMKYVAAALNGTHERMNHLALLLEQAVRQRNGLA